MNRFEELFASLLIFSGEIHSLRGSLLVVLFLECVLVPLNLIVGNRQSKEGEGSWWQLIMVAVKLSLIQLLPMLVGLILIPMTNAEIQKGIAYLYCPIATLIVLFWTSLYLLPPIRLNGTSQALQKYAEPHFLERLEAMCQKLKIAVPVVRIMNTSGGGALGVQAFAGGLPAPSLVVSDGVIYRLTEEEADAIIGHELGHIANGSLWWFPFAVCFSWTLTVVCYIWFGFWVSILFGIAVQTGISRIVSRFFEFDSDRKAATVAGFSTTVKAIDKIHISSVVDNKGWKSFLAYAVATHPSHEERLQALYEGAPDDDLPEVNWSAATARKRRIGGRVAALVWAALLIGSLWLPLSDFGFLLRVLLYLSICLAPSFLMQKAIRKDVKSEMKRRQFKTKSKFNWSVFIATVIIMILLFALQEQVETRGLNDSLGEMIWIIFGLPFVVAVVLLVWGIWRGAKSPQAKIRLAIHQREWSEAVRLGQEFSEKIKSDAPLRHDLNLAVWMTGEQEQAIASMQELRSEFPDFMHPWLIEALMYLEREEPSKSLELIDEVRESLTGDVSVHGIAARCYRRLQQLEKMEEEATAIAEIIPDAAAVTAFRCAIAVDHNNLESARELWETADRLAPGDAYITLLKTELLLLEGQTAEAQSVFESAKALIDATPFAFLGAEFRSVQKKLAEATPSEIISSPPPEDA